MFFLPLFDDNKSLSTPFITIALIAICALIFIAQISGTSDDQRIFIYAYGAVPAVVTGREFLPPEIRTIPSWMSLISSTFLHGGWLHILGNMLFLWIYGDNVEDNMGRFRFAVFYLICGAVASLTHVMIDPSSTTPLVGASGAIAGVMAAYLMMFPRARIRVIMIILIFIRFTYFPAFAVIGIWAVLQVIAVPQSLSSDGGGVAYFAHIGGFIAGLALTPLFKKRGVTLLPKTETAPNWEVTPVPARVIRNEFVERYKRKPRLTATPSVKKDSNASQKKHPKRPWG
jgi:membrane associated rhomboid family serine protease